MAALAQARQAMAANYKALKEDFVSNLTGGEIKEINYVTAVAPAAVLLWSALQARQAFFMPYTPIAFAVDFLLNVGCILLATTLHSSDPILLNILIIAPVTLLLAMPRVSSRAKKAKSPAAKPAGATKTKVDLLPKKPFVTTYRGCMMIVTCVAILAVDFHIFPRRFAKVENWGTSLMDLGVGSFVFAAGLVAARPVLREKMTQTISPLVLGFIRLYSVKGLDYAEHVTEYGVHWNFFFTLAFLPPFVALFESLFHQTNSFAALAIGLGICYQLVLEFTSLKAFILTAPRTELISQNREGICSFFGYLAIFLAGQSTGTYVLPRRKYGGGRWSHQKDVLMKLAGWCAVWSLLYILTTDYRTLNLTVSRRMANLPYIFWVAALNCGQLFAFSTVEAAFFPRATVSDEESYRFATSRVLHAYNRNGLAVFLIANLLTGLVNMSIKTLLVRDQAAMGILIGYVAVVTGVAVGLDAFDIEIKL